MTRFARCVLCALALTGGVAHAQFSPPSCDALKDACGIERKVSEQIARDAHELCEDSCARTDAACRVGCLAAKTAAFAVASGAYGTCIAATCTDDERCEKSAADVRKSCDEAARDVANACAKSCGKSATCVAACTAAKAAVQAACAAAHAATLANVCERDERCVHLCAERESTCSEAGRDGEALCHTRCGDDDSAAGEQCDFARDSIIDACLRTEAACAGACICTPKTAATACAAAQNCGAASDGCGGIVSCGTCASGLTCSAANTCVIAPVDCVVSAFGPWNACSAVCGGGTQTASRTVLTPAANGGAACPTLTETQACNAQPCSCPAGQGLEGAACVTCAAGTSSPGGTADCSPCAAGTYTAYAGQTSCNSCPVGTYSSTIGAASPATCNSCPAGTYSSAIGAPSPAACTSCPAGTTSPAGSGFASACACPSGQTPCSSGCATVATDAQNCGTCGHVCGGGATCSAGGCVPACPPLTALSCQNDLSNVGTGDFKVQFSFSSNQAGRVSLLSQRSSCAAPDTSSQAGWWSIRLLNGQIGVETSSATSDYVLLQSTHSGFNDGAAHSVVAERKLSMLSLTIDCVDEGSSASSASFGALPPLTTVDACTGGLGDGTQVLVGTLTNKCTSGAPDLCANKICTAQDTCHTAGTCEPTTGLCSNPVLGDTTQCSTGLCFTGQTCTNGVCGGGHSCSVAATCGSTGCACNLGFTGDGFTCADAAGSCDAASCTCNDGNWNGQACITCSDGQVFDPVALQCICPSQVFAGGNCQPDTGALCDPASTDFVCVRGHCGADASGDNRCLPPQCSDGIDNNGDGKIDYPNDPGCKSPDDDLEYTPNPLPQCSDGIDNNGDGFIDYPDDPSCRSAADSEITIPPGG